jgi:hypothetical protein
MPKKKPAKQSRTAKKPDPLQALTKRVRALEQHLPEYDALAKQVAERMAASIGRHEAAEANDHPVPDPTIKHARVLAAELLQEDYQRLRGVRLETVRQSLGMSRRPWRDLLPRWLTRLLDRWWGL